MIATRGSQHNFAKGPDANVTRSRFDRTFEVKDTYDFDYLYPIMCDEIIPGDTVNLSVNAMIRLSSYALKVPVMDRMTVDIQAFFVPNRLTWENFERFMGAQDDPDSSTDFIIPTITSRATTGEAVGSMWDKLGLPTDIPGLEVNALPFRAMGLIWNYWYRDQNMQDSLVVPTDDGPDLPTEEHCQLQKRGKRHDRFTSLLPWPQKGPAVEIPLGTTAPIVRASNTSLQPRFYVSGTDTPVAVAEQLQTNSTGYLTNASNPLTMDPRGSIYTDLTNASAATVNVWRQAIMVQSLYELDARGGTRYPELVFAHFRVVVPDFRVQFPEYLGGGSIDINSHPVAQTAPTSGSNAQGQLAAFATGGTTRKNININKAFVEHGFLIVLASARSNLTYQQGITQKFWLKSTKLDFFWSKLQELGEQACLKKEIYAQGAANPTEDEEVLGYEERYAEYRFMPSQIRGLFRSTATGSLDQWHLAEEFANAPELNAAFIESSTPITRALAVTDGPDLLVQWLFNYQHARPMLTYSTPATIGRF